jgi:hypothetical protein
VNAKNLFFVYRILIIVLISFGVCLAAVSDTELKRSEFLGSIVDASGVVVTIFGIWVAIIYPNFVAALNGGVPLNSTSESERYKKLIKSLYRSSFVLCSTIFLLSVFSVFPMTKETPFSRGSFFAYAALVFVSISESLFYAIYNGEKALSIEINKGIFSGVMKRRRRGRRE